MGRDRAKEFGARKPPEAALSGLGVAHVLAEAELAD